MATRLKSIQYAWPMITTLVPDATLQSLGVIPIYIPENSVGTPVSFQSVTVEIGWNDAITATGGTITEHRVALNLGGTDSLITELDDIANTGENMGGVIGPFDFTSKFTSDFGTGGSQNCEVKAYFDQNTGTTLGMVNISAVITITYLYDDTVATHIKTAWIPFENRAGALATTETEIGTNQVPKLYSGDSATDFLPEAGVVIRDYFFVVEGNQNNLGAVDTTLNFKIDSEATFNPGIYERALGSDIFIRAVWSRSSDYPSLSAAHAFKAWSSVAGFHNLVITLVVTYEFTPATSTRVLQSIYVPIEIGSPMGLAVAGASRFTRNIFIQEPGVIALKQSAFRVNYNVAAAVSGLNVRAGSQAYKAHADNGSIVCGMFSLQQRLDSGSSQGAGVAIDRGKNTVVIDMYRTDTTDDPTNINGYILINYHSDKHTSGVGVHSKTIFMLMAQWDALLTDRFIATAKSIAIPEANYWLISVGVISIIWDSASANAFTMDCQVLPGEGKGAGFEDIYADAVQSDAERRCSIVWMRGRDVFKRFPQDADADRLSIETPRDWGFFTAVTTAQGLMFFATYHSITYTIAGTLSGYDGDGSGIEVRLHRVDTREMVAKTTTAVGGSFSFVWYDNTENMMVEARQDSTHLGRSDIGTAT